MPVRTPEQLDIGGKAYQRRRIFATARAAEAWRDQLRGLEFEAEVRPFSDEGETVYAVYVRNPKGHPWARINTYTEGYG